MRVLFAPLAGAAGVGAVTRCLAVAEQAVMRGHRVAFLAPAGYPMLGDHPLGATYAVPRPRRPATVRDGNYATFAEALWVRGMAEPGYLDAAVTAERAAIEAFRPDVIFTEWQATLAVSARLTGVPLVATIATPDVTRLVGGGEEDTAFRHVQDAYAALCRAHGLEAPDCVERLLHGGGTLNVAPTVPALEPLPATLPGTLYAGPLLFAPLELAGAPAPPADGVRRVVVYLSAGTVTIEDLLPELADAFPPPAHDVLVAAREDRVGGHVLPHTFGNVTVTRTPGITRALAGADLLVTRGGQNSLMAAMLAGVPVVGVPGDHVEPRYNLAVLEAHGAARVLGGVPTSAELKEAAGHLAATAAAERARRLGALLRDTPGPYGVVRAMESLASGRLGAPDRWRPPAPAPVGAGGPASADGLQPAGAPSHAAWI
ncbi:hypothetical protein Skr01_63810 [Sphaerisporangium krabiense]|uniref:UDP:flavonoid glycosyltransferase YjiC (YdhE family) n=1 Tax=Sphaerisporangium krabiense TaxID=763782 RepID=A0A7W9DRN3_9ACTN|nr:glycosyltransferase [Sphaerisporangium krabiense]MBB5628299.1 UDP:flavonoid glycosyltransferase YjiC (YdhE family) [Sphaerisporangium krabiense]GII66296.1 hypothetical protein Skr01_63810 [Sphaerisporangium krabiense]